MKHQFCEFGDIGALDGGRVGLSVNAAIADALESCANVPWIEKAREVILKVMLKPIADGAELESVCVSAIVNYKVPARESKVTMMGVRRDKGIVSGLVYDDLSRDNPHQQTMRIDDPAIDDEGSM